MATDSYKKRVDKMINHSVKVDEWRYLSAGELLFNLPVSDEILQKRIVDNLILHKAKDDEKASITFKSLR